MQRAAQGSRVFRLCTLCSLGEDFETPAPEFGGAMRAIVGDGSHPLGERIGQVLALFVQTGLQCFGQHGHRRVFGQPLWFNPGASGRFPVQLHGVGIVYVEQKRVHYPAAGPAPQA